MTGGPATEPGLRRNPCNNVDEDATCKPFQPHEASLVSGGSIEIATRAARCLSLDASAITGVKPLGPFVGFLAESTQRVRACPPFRPRSRITRGWAASLVRNWLSNFRVKCRDAASNGKSGCDWSCEHVWGCADGTSKEILWQFQRGLAELGFLNVQWWRGQSLGWSWTPVQCLSGSRSA